jgi:ATP-dependent RNA helicase DHX57
MLDDVLAARIDNPDLGSVAGGSAEAREREVKVINIVSKLVEFNGLDQ